MLHQNSSIALQSIVSTSIMYNDTHIKASKPFNFNLACKWLVIAICFVNPLSQIAPLAGMTTIFLPKFHEMWPIGVQLIIAPARLPCLVQRFVFTFTPQSFYKLKQFGSTCIAFTIVNPNLWSMSWTIALTSYTNLFITWIILWTKNLWRVEHMWIKKLFLQAIHNCLHIYSFHHLAFF